ncbi:MAG TPA: hypothetical protein VHY20_10625 [Pirellulales bacterium]|jgi:hypothetical protein|nr:hypothetical protein [Pirellulales bacterium]
MATKTASNAQPKAKAQAKSPSPKEMTPLELAAIKQLGKEADKVRDALAVGPGQAVDVTLRIVGTLGVGSAAPFTKTTKPDLAALLEHVLEAAGPKKSRELVQLATASYRAERAISQETSALAGELVETLTLREEDSRRGNVSGSLKAEVVSRAS